MEGEFLRGNILRNGKQLYELTDKPRDTGNGRTACNSASTIVQYTVDWFSVACAGGNCYSQFMHTETVTKVLHYWDCGIGAMNAVVTPESRFTDGDYTQAQLAINYVVQGPTRPINSLKLTLECFGTRQAYADNSRYSFSLTLYNDQPVNATAKLIDLAADDRKPGHTYLGLERTDNQTGQVVRKVIGFYPESSWTQNSGLNVASKWGDDGETDYDQSVKVQLTSGQFYDVIDKLGGPDVQSTYQVGGASGKNCTSMAKYIMNDYVTNLPGGMRISPFGWIYNPADFGQDITRIGHILEAQSGVTVSIGMQKSLTSTNCRLNR